MSKKGIDVSNSNGKIDWDKVKNSGIEAAIIRVGWGSDDKRQDDPLAERNMNECERLGIPYGVYLYSYALNAAGGNSEATHAIRVIGRHKPVLGVYIDMEDADHYKKKKGIDVYKERRMITDICKNFCEAVKKAGFKPGVYASRDYWKNVLYESELRQYLVWLAHWGISKPSMECDIWQYASNGKVDGNGIANMDMDIVYMDSPEVKPVKKTNEEIALEVVDGKWGNGADRKNRLNAAGYDYMTIQVLVNKLLTPNIKTNEEIALEVIDGKWGNGMDRKTRLTKAGYDYQAIQKIVNQIMKK